MTDGLEFAQNDLFDSEKMNRKCLTIGKPDQISEFVTTYEGMQVYTTESDATFHKDKLYNRKAGDTGWTQNVIEETAESSLGTTSIAQAITSTNTKLYNSVSLTLPTSEKFYIITAVEGIVNAGGAVDFSMGVDFLSGNSATLVALCLQNTSSSGNNTHKISCYSRVLRGGTVIWPWFWAGGSVAIGGDTGLTRRWKSITYDPNPNYHESTTLSTSGGITAPIMKVYYRGYY